jgi:DNA primase
MSVLSGVDERRYMFGKKAQAVKEAIPPARYASERGMELRRVGKGLRGRCPIHGGDSTDAFTIDSKKGVWFCHRCSEGGDVIDLCCAVEHSETWEAMHILADRFDVEFFERPPQWHGWQDEKGKRRRMIREALTESYQRRLFRTYGGFLADIENADERYDEAQRLWRGLYPVALHCAEERMSA